MVEEYLNGSLARTYTYGAYIDDPLMVEYGGQRYFYVKDRRFSVTALTDAAGAIVERYEYPAFGRMTIFDAAGQDITATGSTIGNPYGFTGRRFDPETGLWYYRNRMYSPVLGRFLQRDPAGYVDGMNLYAYVQNIPVRYIDPLGLTLNETVASHSPTSENTSNIVVFYALDVPDKEFNEWAVDMFVDNSAIEIEGAAQKAGKTFRVDTSATRQEILDSYIDPNTERIIIIAHGAESLAVIGDVNRKDITPADFSKVNPGMNLKQVDILACHQYKYEKIWEQALGVDVEPHDDEGYMWFWEINSALNYTIPESIAPKK